jgi:hypothetical protein
VEQAPRSERLRLLRRRRLSLAFAIAIGGPLFTILADLWFAHRFPTYAEGHWLAGPGWDVLLAAPFLLLALLLLTTGLSAPAAVLAALGLGAMTALAFWSFATSDSSTAAVDLLALWFYGFPLVLLAFVVDAAVRAWAGRQAREM